jgi:hypothetical protein
MSFWLSLILSTHPSKCCFCFRLREREHTVEKLSLSFAMLPAYVVISIIIAVIVIT